MSKISKEDLKLFECKFISNDDSISGEAFVLATDDKKITKLLTRALTKRAGDGLGWQITVKEVEMNPRAMITFFSYTSEQ